MVTHKMSMLDIVDRVIVIEQGRLVADGPRDSVLAKMRGSAAAAKTDSAARPANLILSQVNHDLSF